MSAALGPQVLIEGALRGELNGRPVDVTGNQHRLVVNFQQMESVPDLVAVVASLRPLRRKVWIAHRILTSTGCSIDIRCQDRPMFRMGSGSGAWWWRLLGWPPMDLRMPLAARLIVGWARSRQ